MTEDIQEKTFALSHCPDTDEGLYSLTLEIKNAHVGLRTFAYSHCKGNNNAVSLYSLTSNEIRQLANLLMDKAWEVILQERERRQNCGAATEEEK